MNGWGLGATFGVLVKPSDRLSFGLTVRTPSPVTFKGDALISNLDMLGFSETSDLERSITLPALDRRRRRRPSRGPAPPHGRRPVDEVVGRSRRSTRPSPTRPGRP